MVVRRYRNTPSEPMRTRKISSTGLMGGTNSVPPSWLEFNFEARFLRHGSKFKLRLTLWLTNHISGIPALNEVQILNRIGDNGPKCNIIARIICLHTFFFVSFLSTICSNTLFGNIPFYSAILLPRSQNNFVEIGPQRATFQAYLILSAVLISNNFIILIRALVGPI